MNVKKNTYIVLLISLCLSTQAMQENQDKQTSLTQDLQIAKYVSLAKVTLISVACGSLFLYHQKQMLQTIKEYPFTYLATTLFTSNYFIDVYIKYKQMKKLLEYYIHLKALSRHMLYAIAIKNTMIQTSKKNFIEFNQHDFCNTITANIPLSFLELETLTTELLKNSTNAIKQLHIEASTDCTEQIYFLFKDNLSIEQALSLAQKEKSLYKKLQSFQIDPEKYYTSLIAELNYMIRKDLHYFLHEQKLSVH